jgi:hypothetical protein
MTRRRVSSLGIGILFILGSCGGKPLVTQASRFASPEFEKHAAAPVCFAPAASSMGLAERARYDDFIEVCANAAREKGVAVVGPASPECLVATLRWGSEYAGSTELNCGYYWLECTAHDAYDKWLNVSLLDRHDGEPVAEAQTVLDSDSQGFNQNTVFALCSAAFHEYPRPMRSEKIEVQLPD